MSLIGKKLTLSAAQETRGRLRGVPDSVMRQESQQEGPARKAAARGHPVVLVPGASGGLPWDLLSVQFWSSV